MRVIPVIDLKQGQVVRAVAGRRAEYRPVVSRLTSSSDPLAVALAFRDRFGLNEPYVADLDAIGGAAPALGLYEALHQRDFRLLVDAGIRQATDALPLAAAGIQSIVAGLETLADPQALAQLAAAHGGQLVFSLDLREGQPLGERAAWQNADAWSIAARAVECGVGRMIVLDLSRVGVGGGPAQEALCRRLATAYPGLELTIGGGIRDAEDLRRVRQWGVRAVLVASALHDGRLGREDLAAL
jgi:phosphoribosylformimino-5-aminoimidazole carboxamide ribotide isomerase